MSSRRSKMELLCEVLESIAQGDNKPTHILYNSRTSWSVLQKLLDFSMEKEYIVERKAGEDDATKRVVYQLTSEGKEVLHNMKHLKNTLNINA